MLNNVGEEEVYELVFIMVAGMFILMNDMGSKIKRDGVQLSKLKKVKRSEFLTVCLYTLYTSLWGQSHFTCDSRLLISLGNNWLMILLCRSRAKTFFFLFGISIN